MGIYTKRDKPAYRDFDVPLEYGNNPHILKWWTRKHDKLLKLQIKNFQWGWYWTITDEIVSITNKEILESWKRKDPLCSKYAWYNIIMNFSIARARQQKFTNKIRKPKWKKCPLCNTKFIESSLPYPLIKRLGIDRLNYCSPCLSKAIFQTKEDIGREEIIKYIKSLSKLLQCIPAQDFGSGINDFVDLDEKTRKRAFQILLNKPSKERVKDVFGSWLGALIESGLLDDDTKRTYFGVQCLAQDGHVCYSLGEKTIDDFLYKNNIPHEKEPKYPEGNFRADFLVDDVLIEYFGLYGMPEYDQKTKEKQDICKRHNIRLISLYPDHLLTQKRLALELSKTLKYKIDIESLGS